MYDKPINLKKDKALGYEYFLDKEHPLANSQGKVYYHRHVASLSLGRWLKPNEDTHHRDGIKDNNLPDNLEVMTRSEHARHHQPDLVKRECEHCGVDTTNKRFCSHICAQLARRKVGRPAKQVLAKEIANHSWVSLGKRYGVSDNAVRKWARQYKLI